MPAQPPAPNAVILFDGECGFCARTVQFITRRDPRCHFRFAPLQSTEGRGLLLRHGLPADQIDSVVLIANGAVFTRSTAALRICRQLSGVWPLLTAFLVLPLTWRDRIYDFVAQRRGNRSSA